jgi:hypothetical protein
MSEDPDNHTISSKCQFEIGFLLVAGIKDS